MDLKENLEALFNLNKEEENLPPVVPVITTGAADDLEFAQTKLKKYIEIGEGVLDEAEALAKSTAEPLAVNAFNNLLKTLGNLSTDVIKSAGEKAKIDRMNKDIGRSDAPTEINNTAIFIGTTSDLLKQMKATDTKVIEGKATEVPPAEAQ